MKALKGYVTHIDKRFKQGALKNWTMGTIKTENGATRFTGFIDSIHSGETVHVKGKIVFGGTAHSIFQVEKIKTFPPTDIEPLTVYVSEICKISRLDAKYITGTFKEATIDTLCRFPERLTEVYELNQDLVPQIIELWNQFNDTSMVETAVAELGLPETLVSSLKSRMPIGTDISQLLYRDPMILFRLELASWKQAASFGKRVKASSQTLKFQRSILIYTLNEAWINGDFGLTVDHIDAYSKALKIPAYLGREFNEKQLGKIILDDIKLIDGRYFLLRPLTLAYDTASFLNNKPHTSVQLDSLELPNSSDSVCELADKIMNDLEAKQWTCTGDLTKRDTLIKAVDLELVRTKYDGITYICNDNSRLAPWLKAKSMTYSDIFLDGQCKFNQSSPFEKTILVLVDPFQLNLSELNSLLTACNHVPIIISNTAADINPQNACVNAFLNKPMFNFESFEDFYWKASVNMDTKPCCIPVNKTQLQTSRSAILNELASDTNHPIHLQLNYAGHTNSNFAVIDNEQIPYLSRISICAKGFGFKRYWILQDEEGFGLTDKSIKPKELVGVFNSIFQVNQKVDDIKDQTNEGQNDTSGGQKQ